jgi:hypothetical protein
MKKLRKLLSTLSLVSALMLTVVPAKTVYADGGSGPQGGSNSTTNAPQPGMTQAEYEYFVWIIVMWLLGWI